MSVKEGHACDGNWLTIWRGLVQDRRVERALLAVPREIFVPEFAAQCGLEAVYLDEAILTKHDLHGVPVSSSSQPAIMASMLDRLDLHVGQRVLEIGAGTGYNAALIAEIVGPERRVISVELDPELARRSRSVLRQAGYRVQVVVGDGRDGWAAEAPYDRIIVTASASEVPRAWLEQTVEGGRIEVPVRLRNSPFGQAIPTLERRGKRASLDLRPLRWLHASSGKRGGCGSAATHAERARDRRRGIRALRADGRRSLSPSAQSPPAVACARPRRAENAHASGKRGSANVSPRLAAEPTGERGPAIEPSQPVGPSPAPAGAGVDQPQSDSPYGLVRLRRGKETRWVDPVAESGARYEQLLGEGFTS